MRFVNKISYSCAGRLAAAMNENHQKRSVYYFSFQIIFGTIVKNIILLALAWLLGVLLPAIVVAVVFASIRILAGGYHMDTYGKCLFISMAMFMLAALTAQYTYQYWNTLSLAVLIAITLVYGLYTLIRYAPKDTPHKPITDPREIKKLKTLSIAWLAMLVIASSLLTFFGLNRFVLSVCFGSILELFAVTPLGNNFFDWVKGGITVKKRKKSLVS